MPLTTYQNLALKYGIQLYNNGQSNEAITQFTKAGQYQLSRITAAQSTYWLAQIYYEKGETATSQSYLDKYFKLADGITWMPNESSQASAYYLQGYNFLEKKDYTHAETSFKSAVQLFQQNSGKLKNEEITEKVWPDALVRLGDCLFKKRDYKAAMTYYNQAIQKKHGSYVYALYQRDIIEGLMDEPFEKILTMMEVKTKPTHDAVLKATADAETRGWAASKVANGESLDKLKAGGMQILPAPAQLKTDMQKVSDTMLKEWVEKAGPEGPALGDAIKR